MISELDIERFSEVARMRPEQGRVPGLFAVAFQNIFSGRKNPGDDRKLGRPSAFPERELENVPGSEVKPSDDLFVLPEERVGSGGEAHEGTVPILPSIVLTAV